MCGAMLHCVKVKFMANCKVHFDYFKILFRDPSLSYEIKVVLEGYRRCPDSHDPSECHHLYDLGRHKFNSHNFDSKKYL